VPRHSAGILLYRRVAAGYEVLLVHPGGPFWAKKDSGSWSIPKGEFPPDEGALTAAKREFGEEIGVPPPEGEYVLLGEFRQPSGKIVHAFALRSSFNLENFRSNMIEIEWPPKSGQMQEFPEVDRAAWTPLAVACKKVVKGQVSIIESLAAKLGQDLNASTEKPQISLF